MLRALTPAFPQVRFGLPGPATTPLVSRCAEHHCSAEGARAREFDDLRRQSRVGSVASHVKMLAKGECVLTGIRERLCPFTQASFTLKEVEARRALVHPPFIWLHCPRGHRSGSSRGRQEHSTRDRRTQPGSNGPPRVTREVGVIGGTSMGTRWGFGDIVAETTRDALSERERRRARRLASRGRGAASGTSGGPSQRSL